jgi:hypothetical protein
MISANYPLMRDTPHNETRKLSFASIWKTAWSPISALINNAQLKINKSKLEKIFQASVTAEMDSVKASLFQSNQFTALSSVDQFFITGLVNGHEKQAMKQINTNLGGYYLDGRGVLLKGAVALKNTFVSQLTGIMENPTKIVDQYRTAAGNQVDKMINGVIVNRGLNDDQAIRFRDKVQVAFLKSRDAQAAQEGGYISPFSYDVLVRAVQEYHIPEALTDFSPSTRRGVGV